MKKIPSDTGVLAAILQFNQDRKPGLVRLKLRQMRADPFTFFRGADHLVCRDWPELRPLDVGPDVLTSGDLHLENFGAHRTTEGDFRYDLNDFDEAVVAACSFDIVRCATSIILASEQWKLKPCRATGMALAYLNNLARFRDGEPSRDSMFAVARTNARRPGIAKSRLENYREPVKKAVESRCVHEIDPV